MKFLLDQDVYALTERFLRGLGYDVITASEAELSKSFVVVEKARHRIRKME